jgi:hypothetical protein
MNGYYIRIAEAVKTNEEATFAALQFLWKRWKEKLSSVPDPNPKIGRIKGYLKWQTALRI